MIRFIALTFLIFSSNANAWDAHLRTLTPRILSSLVHQKLDESFSISCHDQREQNEAFYQTLAKEFGLNPSVKLEDLFTPEDCKRQSVTPLDLFKRSFFDEPDFGMDENLPETDDPDGFRKWMGGTTGPTSKGFRHMYFQGWNLFHPLASFQIPPKAIGYAPDRVNLFAHKANELLKKSNYEKAWGYRLLAWATHYLQDLAQPFHAVQILSLQMIPWNKTFSNLVGESTRIVANYHWAYEEFTSLLLLEPDYDFSCLNDPTILSSLNLEKTKNPRQLALETAKASARISNRLGRALMGFFGQQLKDPKVNLPLNQGTPDYRDFMIRPDLSAQRNELHDVSCLALSNAILASQILIRNTTSF